MRKVIRIAHRSVSIDGSTRRSIVEDEDAINGAFARRFAFSFSARTPDGLKPAVGLCLRSAPAAFFDLRCLGAAYSPCFLGESLRRPATFPRSAAPADFALAEGVARILTFLEEFLVGHDGLAGMFCAAMFQIRLIVGDTDHETRRPNNQLPRLEVFVSHGRLLAELLPLQLPPM